MQFNDTTNRSGIIQACERWTNLGKEAISGDSDLLKEFTADINLAFDEILPLIFASDAKWQWDDANHTKEPIAVTPLVSGQQAYNVIADEQGNSILEITKVYVTDEQGTYVRLSAVDEGDRFTDDVHALNAANTGTPTRYDKLGTAIYLDPVPNDSGYLKLLFSRTASYFASTDTTKTPGIPLPFHELLALIPSKKYVAIHKSDNRVLLATINEAIAERKAALTNFLSKRSKDERTVMRGRVESSR